MVNLIVKDNVDISKLLSFGEEKGKEQVKSTAENIYNLSQQRCPISTDTLRSSGYITEIGDGYEVGYTCDYAERVDILPQSSLKSGVAHFFTSSVEDAKGGVQIG